MQQQSVGDKRHSKMPVFDSSVSGTVGPNAAINYRLENWMYVSDSRVRGCVYGHPNYADGTEITTSRITYICGTTIQTTSGTFYSLGKMAQ